LSIYTESLRFVHIITAKHVIVGIQMRSIDNKVLLRMNNKYGEITTVITEINQWVSHPTDSSVDISVLMYAPDHDLLDYLELPTTMIATDDIIKQHSISLGEEVFIAGLFVNHFGKKEIFQ